jgi:hypothetical protein
VKYAITLLIMVLFLECGGPSGPTEPPPGPTTGTVKLQAGVTFTCSHPIVAYLRSDFFIDGVLSVHLESVASGTSGNDLKEYQTSLSPGTHLVASSGTYGTSLGGDTFSKTAEVRPPSRSSSIGTKENPALLAVDLAAKCCGKLAILPDLS